LGALLLLSMTFRTLEQAYATTYYIAANGSDLSNGTSKTTPWLHAPGMPSCSGVCASITPQTGDQFIFRGGDVWHTSNNIATVYTGDTTSCAGEATHCGWVWSWSGTSTNCNYPSAASSCIYIGVDKTWFSGTSFTRPQLNLDNPVWANSTHQDSSHSGYVTACSFDDYNYVGFVINANYVLVDDFEVLGLCITTVPSNGGVSQGAHIYSANQTNTIENSYFHGWTEKYSNTGTAFDFASMVSGPLLNFSYNVVDGSDAGPPCNGDLTCTATVEFSPVTNFDHNVIRKISNGAGSHYLGTLHDNLFEYMYDSSDSIRHTDVFFTYGNQAPSGSSSSVYNNTVRHVLEGQTFAVDPPSGGKLYIFNNTFFDIGNAINCFAIYGTDTNATSIYFTNNTIESGTSNLCNLDASRNNNLTYPHGTLYFQNNHLIGPYSSFSSFYILGGNTNLTVTDNGNEIIQTESAANGQGYTPSNNYQPTSASGSTYHAGGNLGANCLAYSSDSALCSGSTGGVTNGAGSGSVPALRIYLPTLRRTTWDVGAYQYQPNPPSSLTTVVQ
jgi:hypothetical protein